MLHAGLDLSRRRLDICLLDERGEPVGELAVPPDVDGLHGLVRRLHGQRVRAVIESMNGARFVQDTLEEHGWEVLVADAQKVKGLAPLACKTDRIDARVLAAVVARSRAGDLAARPVGSPRARAGALSAASGASSHDLEEPHPHDAAFGYPCPASDLFGLSGRDLLDKMAIPDPWRSNVEVSLRVIDDLELEIDSLTVQLKQLGADHRYIPLLVTAPGFGWINAFTVASEIGDIERFSSPAKLCGYTGLCPRVIQSGAMDRRGPISKHGPRYLRWGLFEAALNACKHPLYAERYLATKRRLGRQRGPKVAQIDLSRKFTEAIWHLAHAHPQRTVRSGRRPFSSSRLTARFGNAPPERASHFACSPRDGAIET